MAWFQKPGNKVGQIKPFRSNFFRDGDLVSLLEGKFVYLPMMNDDVIVARFDFENQELGLNDIASTLLNRPVYGPVLVCELRELEP